MYPLPDNSKRRGQGLQYPASTQYGPHYPRHPVNNNVATPLIFSNPSVGSIANSNAHSSSHQFPKTTMYPLPDNSKRRGHSLQYNASTQYGPHYPRHPAQNNVATPLIFSDPSAGSMANSNAHSNRDQFPKTTMYPLPDNSKRSGPPCSFLTSPAQHNISCYHPASPYASSPTSQPLRFDPNSNSNSNLNSNFPPPIYPWFHPRTSLPSPLLQHNFDLNQTWNSTQQRISKTYFQRVPCNSTQPDSETNCFMTRDLSIQSSPILDQAKAFLISLASDGRTLRLPLNSELYSILTDSGFTDSGKVYIVSELYNYQLLKLSGLDVVGCLSNADFPSHLKQVSYALRIRHRLQMVRRQIRLRKMALCQQRNRARKKKKKQLENREDPSMLDTSDDLPTDFGSFDDAQEDEKDNDLAFPFPNILEGDTAREDDKALLDDNKPVIKKPEQQRVVGKCLFIGMSRKIPPDATIHSLLLKADGMHRSDLCDVRDGARLLKAAEYGFEVYSLDRKESSHPSHFSISLEGFDRQSNGAAVTKLRQHVFMEISVDFVWMPGSYLYDTVLTKSFFSSTLPFLAGTLEDHGRLYFPATKPLFERTVQFWPSLCDLFILRFIRQDQLEESCLYRATMALPMERLGKQGAEEQVGHYQLSFEEAKSVPGVPNELLEHFPCEGPCVRFLCLTKKPQTKILRRWQTFSECHLEIARPRKLSRQVVSLARETLEIISKPSLDVRSIRIHKPAVPGTGILSPYHAMYLNGCYGRGRNDGNKTEALSDPKFTPESVGDLKVTLGGWCCVLCTTMNEAGRPLHLCRSCSFLPTRLAKLRMTTCATSKFFGKTHSDDSASDSSDSDQNDEAFSVRDERRIAKQQELSEFGRKWRAKDTRGANERSYELLRQMDQRMSSTDRSTLWWTCIAFPISDSISAVRVSKKFQLQKIDYLKAILSKTVVAVQKNYVQFVCAFRLERNPHAVMGYNAVATFAKSFLASIQWMDNSIDHFFDAKRPDHPIVCNTDSVAGLDDKELMDACGFPKNYLGMSLRQQLKHCLDDGLVEHANEYVQLCISDHRGTASFHAGLAVQEGAQWTRKNGCGIAYPGLMLNSTDTSPAFRQWLLQQEVLIGHAFTNRFLLGTDRDQQGIPTKYRLQILEEWYDYLNVPTAYRGLLRIGGGLSLNSGAVSFHQDHLQDPSRRYDQIAWGSLFIKSWATYLSKENLNKLKEMNVATDNTMFTALVYSRSITGSQAAKLEGVVNETCPLFQCCVSLINNEKFISDYNYLDDRARRNCLINTLVRTLEDGSQQEFQYNEKYARIDECNNRCTFLGSFASVWFRFLDMYRGHVCAYHCFEYTSFVMRECNGSPLFVETMRQILEPGKQPALIAVLHAPTPALYIFLATEMRRVYGGTGGVICSDAPRWQMIDLPMWSSPSDNENTGLYVDFVVKNMWIIATGTKAEQTQARNMICSRHEREKSKSLSSKALQAIRLGPVRGTFGIQLSAYLLGTPGCNGHYATIEKGKSGFYKCVALHLKQKLGSKQSITTVQAQEEVAECIAAMEKMGFPVHIAWMDQNCCYWHRKYGRDDGTSGLKKDCFFFDSNGQLFLPMRTKAQKGRKVSIQFFILDSWYNFADYWQPLYEMDDLEGIIRRRCEIECGIELTRWVKCIGRKGTIDGMRRDICRKPDGTFLVL